jgi:hypothetical protein
VCTACLLRCAGNFVERAADGRNHRRGYRTLDQRGVNQSSAPIALALEHMPDGENGATDVTEDDHSVASIRPADRVPHEAVVGAQRAVGRAARDLDPDLWACHLAGQIRHAARKVGAMRDNYDPNHLTASVLD